MKNHIFAKTVARIALPLAIGAAALGMAGIASAQTQEPVGPGYQYAPTTTAHPAPQAPTTHHGVGRVEEMVPGYHR
ncbi:hypothetical protein [Mycolicibacterium gadium]|jgi:hypothetical protein|uniref:Uncharacterized protein n=1 Tax=Mycolicibacterium gadium TaxID=1794 RepID=A0A7I7WNP8_MYCGU|nr:hypothetical protein [Mycolicibacterium gadium]BBZ18153.1 hypothetical protein MGAD_24880 [Mycolicibacterium gadium]